MLIGIGSYKPCFCFVLRPKIFIHIWNTLYIIYYIICRCYSFIKMIPKMLKSSTFRTGKNSLRDGTMSLGNNSSAQTRFSWKIPPYDQIIVKKGRRASVSMTILLMFGSGQQRYLRIRTKIGRLYTIRHKNKSILYEKSA